MVAGQIELPQVAQLDDLLGEGSEIHFTEVEVNPPSPVSCLGDALSEDVVFGPRISAKIKLMQGG